MRRWFAVARAAKAYHNELDKKSLPALRGRSSIHLGRRVPDLVLRSSSVLERGALLNSRSLNVREEGVECFRVEHVAARSTFECNVLLDD
jgi:hypothetical protein